MEKFAPYLMGFFLLACLVFYFLKARSINKFKDGVSMLKREELNQLLDCDFREVNVSADVTDTSHEGLEIREIVEKRIAGEEVGDLKVDSFSLLPCSYSVSNQTYLNEDTILTLKKACLTLGKDANFLFHQGMRDYYSVMISVTDFIRFFAINKNSEVELFIDGINGKTISYFTVSFPFKTKYDN